jgi:threonylcarbamoyladenosine tRNA methylthiotransferase MtaB
MHKVSFHTLGCRLNQAEEESLRREFLEAGFMITEPKNADLIIINTCSVTTLADKKSRQAIRKLKNENCKLKIVVIGCGAEAAKDMPEVDLIIPNKDKVKVLKIVSRHLNIDLSDYALYSIPHTQCSHPRTRALLKVQDGCNNFCTYCIIPHLRGREVSVPASKVLEEAKKMEKLGYKELVISGVNVGKYKYSTDNEKLISQIQNNKNIQLVDLIRLILEETDFPRIRLSSINPQDITDELIGLWVNEERLCRHFHLSLQSGSDTVLKRMGRPYSVHKYYSVVKKITQKIKDVAITTDIIVGFPGETEEEFQETCDFVNKVGFSRIHVFPYSKRGGTRAALMNNQVDQETKKQKSKTLREIGDNLRRTSLKQFREVPIEVLFEEKKGDYWYGLTSNYIKVRHKSKQNLTNTIKTIKLNKSNTS